MTERAFLDVDASLSGRRWIGPGPMILRQADAIAQHTGLALSLARVLATRGIAPDAAQEHLTPTLRALMPDPRSLHDMERAAARLCHAVTTHARIAIFGDYDVDGGASAALLITWLRALGQPATLYIPDRITEGYGPNAPAMAALARDHDLIVTVDCGTLSHDAIAAAAGTDVIVLDHHLGGETLPPAYATVNPNRQDEDGSLAHLCAAAVVFLCLAEATRQRREAGLPSPNLLDFLDLVALATVADVAPLIGVNRAFVRQGLAVMAKRARPGLAALGDIARLEGPPSAYHLGYLLGPRINAGGRIGQADLGARLLATADPNEARSLAEKLDMLNTERREIETQVRDAALAQAQTRDPEAALVWAAGDNWHPGVVGIAAARLKEETNRPAIVIGIENGIGKGSGRSVAGIDLGAAIQRLAHERLITQGGGHKMAAGLTLSASQIDAAMERLTILLAKQGANTLGPQDLPVAGLLTAKGATAELVEQLETAGPFGAGAPAPRFAFADATIRFAKQVGSGHLKLSFSDASTGRCDAIAFGAADTAMGHALLAHAGARFHLSGRLDINHWQGRKTVQLRLEDAAPAP